MQKIPKISQSIPTPRLLSAVTSTIITTTKAAAVAMSMVTTMKPAGTSMTTAIIPTRRCTTRAGNLTAYLPA